ncbi:Target of Myb protein 1 [Rhynchospora pubera]|uniref:Target of Myb protein 1 n=1 Tax=Rhynchospora pubera TaxID=906938 RepID=A0AAV8HWE8_9POAL|nr:Target of Myb protein 1 [Rhynchospora pubera]
MMSSLGHVSASSLVEKATSHLLIGPDWAMNLEICDMINTNRWQIKEVVRAIRKRLQNKHSNVQFLAMTLLETMMKNCGESVRFEVAQHEVLPEMVKIVRKQTDFQVRDKALILLDSWQEAFGGPGGQHPQYYWAYIELKRSGVQFPRRAPDAPLTFENATSSSSHLSAQPYASGIASNSQTPGERGGPAVVHMSMSELHNMRSAMELLSEMLRAVNPRDRVAIKDEVITDLVSQCKSSQNKLVQLINSTGDEQVLAEALTINDSLQNVIEKYEAIASGSLPPEPAPVLPSPVAPPPVAPAPVVEETKFEEDEDDEFAQIAQRKSKGKGVEQEATSSQSDVTVEESVASNAFVVIDQPPPTEASKQQDMIDLLTLALYDPNPTSSDNSTPPQPATTSPTSTTTVDPNPWALVPVSSPASPPSPQPQPLPQTYYPYNQGYNYNPYNNYVASWAQPAAQPTQTQYYPSNPYAFPSTQYQVPPAPAPAYAPMQRFNSFGGAAGASNITASPVTAIPTSSSSGGNPMNVSQPALKKDMPAGSKPYYMPDNLFGDLIDVKSFGAGNKVSNRGSSSMTSSPGKPMVNGKK